MTLRLLDLFSGAGGLSEGFRQVGYRVLGGTDLDPDACATFQLNFPEANVVCGDLRENAIREEVMATAARADVIVGGPPCQAFSQVRNHVRLIDDPRNALYREFVRIVGLAEPVAFVMENVQGLEQMGVKDQVIRDLSLNGRYRVVAQLLDAADFGVPQTRKRLIFIGFLNRLGLTPPALVGSEGTKALSLERQLNDGRAGYRVVSQSLLGSGKHFLERLLDPDDDSLVTAEQAIGDLRILTAATRKDGRATRELPLATSEYQRTMRRRLNGSIENVAVPKINADTVLRLQQIPEGGNHRDLPSNLRQRYITGERWGPDSGSGLLERKHYYAYRKLHPNFWSWTINTKADSVYHFADLRALSVREFARLQSFPDDFVFTTDSREGDLPGRIEGGAGHSRYRQVGNAVPPLLARAIGEAVKECLLSTSEWAPSVA